MEEYELIRTRVSALFNDTLDMMDSGAEDTIPLLRHHCDDINDMITEALTNPG